MKREKRLTKKERKATERVVTPARVAPKEARQRQHRHEHQHIHCIACGKHLHPQTFGEPGGPNFIRCEHGSDFAHCGPCHDKAKALVEEHDRTNQPVKKVAAWH